MSCFCFLFMYSVQRAWFYYGLRDTYCMSHTPYSGCKYLAARSLVDLLVICEYGVMPAIIKCTGKLLSVRGYGYGAGDVCRG